MYMLFYNRSNTKIIKTYTSADQYTQIYTSMNLNIHKPVPPQIYIYVFLYIHVSTH